MRRRKNPNRTAKAAPSRGAALVEFAVVLPVLIMVLFGIIEFGIAFTEAQAVESAAREAARVAAISSSTEADINARAAAALGHRLATPLKPGTNITPGLCAGRNGETVTVVISEPHQIDIPLVNSWNITLDGSAVFRCES